jgi:prepilin-type N-terminal cleavage/methylation domain-containing protein
VSRFTKRRGQKGFTLIELLIVVAIIGIIAAILIPNLLDALQKAKQKRTVADMRDVGSAWFSWLTDQVSAAAAGAANTYDPTTNLTLIDQADLQDTLYISPAMFYIQEVPRYDGWAHLYQYYYESQDNPLASDVMAIVSLGKDRVATDGPPYNIGSFLASDYVQDIVWANGFFMRYPAGARVQSSP